MNLTTILLLLIPALTSSFIIKPTQITTVTSLNVFKGKDYEKTVQNLMVTKGLTKEQAEKDYNAYLENPTNYALNKVRYS